MSFFRLTLRDSELRALSSGQFTNRSGCTCFTTVLNRRFSSEAMTASFSDGRAKEV